MRHPLSSLLSHERERSGAVDGMGGVVGLAGGGLGVVEQASRAFLGGHRAIWW
jgi:hypothetical protein